MVDLPYESLIGVSFGLLVGFVPALLVGVTAIGSRLVADRSLPVAAGLAAVPIALGTGVAASVFDPGAGLAHGYRLMTAAIVVGILGVVAASQGTRIGAELPRDRSFPTVRGRALSADAIDAVDAAGHVTIRPTGSIREFEGYPSLSPDLRTALEAGSWRLPADLQLSELERRLERRLRTEYGLSKVDVSVDGRGRATIAAAPPTKGVAATLSDGTRAVTVSGLLPTGIEPGDRVAIDARSDDGAAVVGTDATDNPIRGEVRAIGDGVDVKNDPGTSADTEPETDARPAIDVRSSEASRRYADAGADGGWGSLTVIVETADAGRLLEAERCRIAVLPSGDTHAFEAAALLEEAGRPITAVEAPDDGELEGDGAETLGVHSGDEWEFTVESDGDTASDGDVDGEPTDPNDGADRNPPDRAFVAGTARTREVTDE